MTLQQQDKPAEFAKALDESATASAHRQPSRLQQRLAAFGVAELEASKWQNRLSIAAYVVVMGTSFTFLFILIEGAPEVYPRDLKGLVFLLGFSAALVALLSAAYCVNEWIEDRVENYWIWRTAGVMLFLAMAGGMFCAVFASTDFWLPHFR